MEETASLHGHACPGQVLGVRMAVLGCSMVEVDEPTRSKDLIVYVEIDRCVTDAVQAVTGCKLGKRTLKFQDYGKVAATFVNTTSQTAFRVVARDDSRELVPQYAPDSMAKGEAQSYAYRVMPDKELFDVMPVTLDVPEQDLPGRPVSRIACESCGEGVNDRREVVQDGRRLCVACANGAYYSRIDHAVRPAGHSFSTNGTDGT
jgi:formylmethanofuran dehydrogenase subunit E